MRNLKKILALVLAMVMAFSVMATANAFTDDSKIDETYEEAVEVLSGLGVFEGYEDGSFQPKGSITRAEVAAIIYRVVTGDVDDEQVGIYADYNKFTDVKSNAWYAGYVNFCANAEYIKGYGDGKFGPQDQVTGYQALAMILRAIGYDKNGEFTGSNWQVQTAAVGKKLGVTDNVSAGTLNTAATREVVAEILFQTIATAPQVEYTVAFGYQSISLSNGKTNTLGWDTFGLTCGNRTEIDVWGRPGYTWTATKPASVKGTVATIAEKPDATYHVATTECQIASDIGFSGSNTYTVRYNGYNTSKYIVQATDTVGTVGAQGTLVEVYGKDRIVMIDTYLAQVTKVTKAVFDAAGHLKTPAYLTLHVFDKANNYTEVTLSKKTDWTYAVGEMILVNAYTGNDGIVKNDVNQYVEIVGYAESVVGAQTYLWYNLEQHTVEGTTYNDAKWFKLDQANTETTKHTWWFDQYGNLIGATDIATEYNYGIIVNIQWVTAVGANGSAQATIMYMDGTTASASITSIEGKKTAYAGYYGVGEVQNSAIAVSTEYKNNSALCGTDLYRIETLKDGSLALTHVATTQSNKTTKKNEITNATIKTGISAIQGTANTQASVIYVNTDTVFMVKTSTGYEIVTGYTNVEKYTKNGATVDWVNLDSDIYAEYVYIIGTPDTATSTNLFYLTSNNTQAVLKDGVVDYYVVKGYLDGVLTEDVKVAPSVITSLIPSINPGNTTSYVNNMFVVSFNDGEIVTVSEPKTWSDLGANIGGIYANQKLAFKAAAATATWDGEVLALTDNTSATFKFNVVGLTPVVGTFDANMTNKEIYVIYDTTVSIEDAYVAKAVYVADAAESATPSTPTPSAWVGNGYDGYWSNTQTKAIVTPAGSTLTQLASRYSGVATAVYYTTNPAGETYTVTVNSTNNGDMKVDNLLAMGATITYVNSNGKWTVID